MMTLIEERRRRRQQSLTGSRAGSQLRVDVELDNIAAFNLLVYSLASACCKVYKHIFDLIVFRSLNFPAFCQNLGKLCKGSHYQVHLSSFGFQFGMLDSEI
jgi:hypothetical protein